MRISNDFENLINSKRKYPGFTKNPYIWHLLPCGSPIGQNKTVITIHLHNNTAGHLIYMIEWIAIGICGDFNPNQKRTNK